MTKSAINKAKFEKLSYEQFKKDWIKTFPEDEQNNKYIEDIYNNIKLPKRSTSKSAGYDFYLPMDAEFYVGGSMIIPTGIRCTNIPDNEVLAIYSHNKLGYKYTPATDLLAIINPNENTDKEGQIFIKITNNGCEDLSLNLGNIFCHGILLPYNTTIDDEYNND